MFGWRRKRDGFVWNEYVRTTILVRRENRRQRVEDIRVAAVDGIKQAGRQGVAMGAAGAQAAGRGVWAGAQAGALATWDWLTVASAATVLWLGDRLGPLPRELASGFAAFGRLLLQPAMSVPLLLIGTVAALSAVARATQAGFDTQAIVTAAVAMVALVLGAIPHLANLPGMSAFGDRLAGVLPHGRPQVGDAGAALGLGAVLAAVIGVFSWLVPSLMTPPGGTASVPVQAVMTPASGRLEGRAVAIAADQLKVGVETVHLFGVEAPAAGQTCGQGKSCAANAKTALQKLIGGKRVSCDVSGRASDVGVSAACQVNGADIAGQLVRGGHVFSTTGLFATYASAEREARAARVGVWRGDAIRPAEFRAKAWEDAKRAAPDGCPIKGVVAADVRTFLVPGTAAYEKAKVRAAKGERWFCTEAEARAAGFKPADLS
jgi:endonuclease YncB( thermonuclease family)